jgi:hypothetical protein
MTADAVAVGTIWHDSREGKDWQREKPGRAIGCVSGRQPPDISGDPHRNYQSRLNQRQTDVQLPSATVLNPSSRSKAALRDPVQHQDYWTWTTSLIFG